MALSKVNLTLIALVMALTIACIVLIVAYVNALKGAQDDSSSSATAKDAGTDEEFTQSPTQILTHPWEKNVRLPAKVFPDHYDLYLHPNLETGLFSGSVDIHIDSKEIRDHFLVHVKNLNVESARVFRGTSKKSEAELDLMEAFEYTRNEFYVMRPSEDAKPGQYIISMDFNGNLTNGIVGFYKSVYTNAKGESIPIATSKFQPTYARRAFPCFDEPSFKSTFNITMIRPTDGYIALSNMPVEEEVSNSPNEGLTEVKFQKSVPMVTYLACFIVCDFAYEEIITKVHKTQFRVYATPTQKDRINYSLQVGANITDYFTTYFDVPYPLPKQDMIAIPDFVSGAMEHWGLITYRETSLLYDSRESSSSNKQRVATVVSHELAHQWFGNLVTLSWWDDLWLNEGFASYMEYKGVANYHDDWEIEDQFLILDLHRVFALDATVNSHPIVQPVDHPDQITEIFDAISYSKGASVLRMLENFMGAENFRQGVSNFLKKYEYANAITNDLWMELSKVADDLNITSIMDTWTRQMGLPLVTVEKVGDNKYRLTQERYLLDPAQASKSEASPFNYKWDIPITWVTDIEGRKMKWLPRDEGFTEIEIPNDAKWVKFNEGQFGYYRVHYPLEQWLEFSEILKQNHEVLDVKDRASLINDAFALAESGQVEYSLPLAMIQYLKNDKSYVTWKTALNQLHTVESLLTNSEAFPYLRKYLLSLVEERYNYLGWNDVGTHSEKQSRVNVLSLACRNGHSACLREAGKLFEEWIQNYSYISPNLRPLVYRYGMQSRGDARSWQVMLERFMQEQNAQEKRKLLIGLAFVSEPWILKQFLRQAKNETIIRSQDYTIVLRYIAANPIGNPIVWDFLREEWPYLVERFTLNDRYLGRLPKSICANFNTKFQLNQMEDFFRKYPDAGAGARARKQALETVENNIVWLEKHEASIHRWLLENPTQ